MTLPIGSRVGPYEILAPLGVGGMGEVFRARDTRLNRDVAIKVLPPGFAQDAERVARFRREAQLLASLNHSNIAAIYGIEETADVVALALELVEGEDLAERLQRGPIPVDEAVAIAKQIAEGLEAAHDKGIVHRDLKPANIKLGKDGAVKLLDFGLARAYAGDTATVDSGLTQSPTITRHMTEVGVILGTAAYMSPEQARGRPLDKRSDIWSFGIVLFEMLTGRPQFGGETVTDVLASVLKTDPDWAGLPVAVPANLRALLKRCLERDPKRRMRDIGEARIALENPFTGAASSLETAPPSISRRRALLPWALAVIGVAIATTMTAVWLSGDKGPRPPLAQFEIALPEGAEQYAGLGGTTLAFSPDGSSIAFITSESGARSVHLRRLDSLESRVVMGGLAPLGVFFSPDGSLLGIIGTDRIIKQVSVRDLAVSQRVKNAGYPGAAFLPDGRVVCVREETLWIAPVGVDEPLPLTKLDASKDERSHRWPIALPAGDIVLFTVISGADLHEHIEGLRVATGERFVVEARGTLPMYVAPGFLLFGRDGALLAAPFDASTVRVTGAPTKILERVSRSGMGVPVVAAAATGHIVYLPPGAALRTLTWVDRDGVESPLPLRLDSYDNPRVAPDGRRIAVTAEGGIWIADPERGTLTRLTASGDFPVWSQDGTQVFYRNDIGMLRIAADGSGSPQPFPIEAANEYPSSTSPDGKLLASLRITSATGGDLHVRPVDGSGTSVQVLASKAYEGAPAFSSDGRWLTYTSDDSGRMEVYIRPFPSPDRRWQVSNEGGTHPRWHPRGDLIYYRQGRRMMAVDVRFPDAVPELSRPRLLFDENYRFGGNLSIPNYDVAPDGSRLLMVKNQRTMTHLSVMLNWPELMRER